MLRVAVGDYVSRNRSRDNERWRVQDAMEPDESVRLREPVASPSVERQGCVRQHGGGSAERHVSGPFHAGSLSVRTKGMNSRNSGCFISQLTPFATTGMPMTLHASRSLPPPVFPLSNTCRIAGQ